MKQQPKIKYNFIFSGGGTGGHLFPLIAVAEQIKLNLPDSNILFVGTENKIESRVVPAMGYDFKSVSISGFPRKLNLESFKFVFKLIIALFKSLAICIKFKPHVAIGAGAYVSGPIIWAASITGAKIVLLEQNSYPGITNRLLEKKADKVFISFEDSRKYFRFNKKLILAGNPLRVNIQRIEKSEALKKFDLLDDKKTIVVLGGSLGAKTINNSIEKNVDKINELNLQVIWQCGEKYYPELKKYNSPNIKVLSFIEKMGDVYSSADLLIARAGATTIAEIAFLGLPVIFIPSPNVTDDHQYKNAKSIEDNNGAIVVKDNEAEDKLFEVIKNIINDKVKLETLENNIKLFAKPDAAKNIGAEVIDLAINKNRL